MKTIPLTRGLLAMVDDSDYLELSKIKWYAHCSDGSFYAARKSPTMVYMHRKILGVSTGAEVDHRNRNTLDNRRNNLRVCSREGNARNKICEKHTSKFKGVSWYKTRNKWRVGICHDRIRHFIGYFTDEITAAKAYDMAAKNYFGEFAYLNFK